MKQPKKHWSIAKEGKVLWLQSPRGEKMFFTGVQCVGPTQHSLVKGGIGYNGAKIRGSLAAWFLNSQERLKDWNFRGLGAWNHPIWGFGDFPFSVSLNLWKNLWVKGKLKPIFDADWEAMSEKAALPELKRWKDNVRLTGFFLDNEIHWGMEALFFYFDKRPVKDPNRVAVVDFLRKKFKTIAALNRAWKTSFKSFDGLGREKTLRVDKDLAHAACEEFLGVVAGRFFKLGSAIIRRNAPGVLVLGARHAGLPPRSVSKAQRGHTDVYSVNMYLPEAKLPEQALWQAHRDSGGQPVWITEFSFHAPFDNRSGDRNTIGFGARVWRQSARGPGYQSYVSHAASLPFMIGVDWFQHSDEPPQGRSDGEDVNFGMVDIKDQPYEGLVGAMRKTNARVDGLHRGSKKWRLKPFGFKPSSQAVAAFGKGGLKGMSPLNGLRFRPGPDKVPARPTAKASMAWTPEALLVSVESTQATKTIEMRRVKSSDEWFWMTDATVLMLRSGADAPHFYDKTCFKVWALPDASKGKQPSAGIKQGDESLPLNASKVRVRQWSIGSKSYRMEIYVPYTAIQKEKFRAGQDLRLNLMILECARNRETYWGSHQGHWPTRRPLMWGSIRLA